MTGMARKKVYSAAVSREAPIRIPPRMVAPVVVKPETVSKSASMKNGISRLRTNGSAPMTARMSQHNATVT